MATTQDDVILVEHEEGPAVTDASSQPDHVDVINDATLANGRTLDDATATPDTPAPTGGGEAYVCYSGTGGGVSVVKRPTLVRNVDGSVTIVTPRAGDHAGSTERPLREKDVRCLLIFSVIGVLLFPPVGVVALVLAALTRRAYTRGLSAGDLGAARKMARRAERAVVLALILGLVMYVVIFTLLEQNVARHPAAIPPGHLHFG